MHHHALILIAIGVFTGIYSGIMGLGGGTVMIPIMVLALGFTQHQAVGTSLAAMLAPVAIFAVLEFHSRGDVNVRTAIWLAVGILGGAWLGARIANMLPDVVLKLIFGFVLVYVAGYMIFSTQGKEHIVRSMLLSGVLAVVALGVFLGLRWYAGAHAGHAAS